MRPSLLVAVALLATGCPRRVPDDVPRAGEPRAFQLLADTAERETTQIKEVREDVEVDTHDFERTPRVVATGETAFMKLGGAHAKLYGDKAGTQGWSVDNFLLLEVFGVDGKRIGATASGYTDTVAIGTDHVDNAGRRSFTFEPGEVDVTSHLPEREPFKLRATALDIGGVGRVSDVWLLLSYPAGTTEDELKENSR